MSGSRICPVAVYGKTVTARRRYRKRITNLFIRTFFLFAGKHGEKLLPGKVCK
jgi:hypothetical protein